MPSLPGVLVLVVLLQLSCGFAQIQAADQGTQTVPSPISFTIGIFPFTRPSAWAWVIPSSAMRKVQLSITSPDGKDTADVSFFTFGNGEGGTVQANVDRWAKQFSAPDGSPVSATTESRTIGSISITFVSAHGSFSAGMSETSSGPKPGYGLRGAILESPAGGGGDLFVKMTGPEELVLKATPTFDAMINKACQEAVAP